VWGWRESRGFLWELVQKLREVLRDGTKACGNTAGMELITAGNLRVFRDLGQITKATLCHDNNPVHTAFRHARLLTSNVKYSLHGFVHS